jgi:two-component system NtrC family sensor kinase
LVATILSLLANLHKTNDQYAQLANVVARSFYQAIVTMRNWNTLHNGVYVPITEAVRPNPYLVDPLRDVTTVQGLRLTKINHAQMTRMLSELLTQDRGVHIHLTSLTPLQPINVPDAWERRALEAFSHGKTEMHEVIETGQSENTFRYMAALIAEPACLNCHHEHKNVNEIRGGISISFDFAPFEELRVQSNRQIWFLHVAGLSISLFLVTFLGRKLILNVDNLMESRRRIRQLEGLVPICAGCKKIRNEGSDARDQDSWVPVEQYISERTNTEFTHSLCPECLKNLYPDFQYRRDN